MGTDNLVALLTGVLLRNRRLSSFTYWSVAMETGIQ